MAMASKLPTEGDMVLMEANNTHGWQTKTKLIELIPHFIWFIIGCTAFLNVAVLSTVDHPVIQLSFF